MKFLLIFFDLEDEGRTSLKILSNLTFDPIAIHRNSFPTNIANYQTTPAYAIPRIGCGIDGLEWDKVCAEINEVFYNDNVNTVVYNFVPK
uniref:Macro domain-containing protein n=1 Tax=Glossina pallidipes TaxID=7398 RepID=A0A1A9ZW17_GLOPL